MDDLFKQKRSYIVKVWFKGYYVHYLRPPSILPPRDLLEGGRTRDAATPFRWSFKYGTTPLSRTLEIEHTPPNLRLDTLPSDDRLWGE